MRNLNRKSIRHTLLAAGESLTVIHILLAVIEARLGNGYSITLEQFVKQVRFQGYPESKITSFSAALAAN